MRSKKELKEDNISTRNLVRQKTKNLAELAQKQVDSDVKEEKMIEDIQKEFKIQEDEEKNIHEEFDKQEMDDIEKEFQNQESKQP